jgi:beta-barrel assembly-enhancing protease
MPKTLFQAIGYRLGQKAAQAKSAFDLMGGTEEESLRAEIRLGRDMAAALLERTPLVEENQSTKFAAQILHWLAPHVKERTIPFSLHVTAERQLNALALPGGSILLSWPLLATCRGERDEIAFVLGHEMAHIVRRHTLDRILKDAAVSLLLRQTSGRATASTWLNRAGREMLSRAYSRDDELGADAFAQDLVSSAGGEPLAGETILQKIAEMTSGQSVAIAGDYFACHPSLTERVANLRAKRRE